MLQWLKSILGIEREPTEILGDFESNLAGVTATNANGVNRQTLVSRLQRGDPLLVIRERRNRHDQHVVAIARADGAYLGHIPSRLAPAVAALLDDGGTGQGRVIAVTGGEPDKPTFGVVIRVVVVR